MPVKGFESWVGQHDTMHQFKIIHYLKSYKNKRVPAADRELYSQYLDTIQAKLIRRMFTGSEKIVPVEMLTSITNRYKDYALETTA